MSDDPLRPLKFRARAWLEFRRMPGLHAPVRSFLRIVPRGGVAIDVGAHDGTYSYWMARRAKAVHAFEPRPLAAEAVRRLRIRNVTVHEVALSDGSGTAELFIPRTLVARASIEQDVRDGWGAIVTVERAPLDEFDLRDVRFLKIDVEGHELAVIQGARETIARDRPTVFCESEERHHEHAVGELIATMTREFGYKAYFWRRGELVPIEQFRLQEHQVARASDVLSPEYVNNFVFRSRSPV